jgi:hypothetical protein
MFPAFSSICVTESEADLMFCSFVPFNTWCEWTWEHLGSPSTPNAQTKQDALITYVS